MIAVRSSPWQMMALGHEAWRLWYEASSVVTLRTLLLVQGGAAAHSEAARMVEEKWAANMALGLDWAAGRGGRTPHGSARRTMRHYRTRAAANRKRLSR